MKVFLVRFWVVLCLAVCIGAPRFAQAQGNKLNKSFGTIGDSELRGCVTIWYWSQLGLTPIEDWHYNERRGHELSSLLVYLSNGRLRTRANTAWGGTTARDWATNGRLSAPGQSTPNSVHADQSRSLRWKPGLVFICVGMNDATIVPGATLSPKDHTAYLGQIVDAVKKTGATPFVLIAPPRDDDNAAVVRDLDKLTVRQALNKMVELDTAYCQTNQIPYLDTRAILGIANSPSTWIARLRYDGVHFHAPTALKVLARALVARPEIQAFFVDPVKIAETAPTSGSEVGNLLQYACFQGTLDSATKRPLGWDLGGDASETTCRIALSKPNTGSGVVGNILSLTRLSGSATAKKVTQVIPRGFSTGGVMRISGLFRASGFGDRFWHSPANGTEPDIVRCNYSVNVIFLDANGAEIPNTRISPCDAWSIDTNGDFWRFYQDFVVPMGAKALQVQVQSAGTLGLANQNAKFEVANLSLRFLGPSGNARVYP